MSITQKIFIAALGIIISFVLYSSGEKYKYESAEYGWIVQKCEVINDECSELYMNPGHELNKKYGIQYWAMEQNIRENKIYIIIPFIIIVIAVFIGFTFDEREALMTALVLSPLFATFLIKLFFGPECCLTPFYLLFAVGAATLIAKFKRVLFEDP